MPLPVQIETERLSLRPPRLEDAEPMFVGYAQDAEVTKYLQWRPHQSIADTKDFLEICLRERQGTTAYHYTVERKSDGQVLGSFNIRLNGDSVDFGYVLAKAYWSQGNMTEALKAGVAWALAQPEIQHIWATCDVDNKASARVMEKAGLVFDGLLPKHTVHPNLSADLRDSYRYAIHR